MWGTRSTVFLMDLKARFIPTDVGNTCPPMLIKSPPSVHPPGCGEHSLLRKHEASQVRFIPTDVGNTQASPHRVADTAVHPHGCGEHVNKCSTPIATIGSSPRMWGTPR